MDEWMDEWMSGSANDNKKLPKAAPRSYEYAGTDGIPIGHTNRAFSQFIDYDVQIAAFIYFSRLFRNRVAVLLP